jgi:Flp pilus assembly protein TadD
LHNLAMLEALAGRQNEALALIEKALALDPDAPEIHKHRGVVLQALAATPRPFPLTRLP